MSAARRFVAQAPAIAKGAVGTGIRMVLEDSKFYTAAATATSPRTSCGRLFWL
ncbi:hypothetical protein [Streptomyces anulatus]|uniref:hypothetical protein n=1 Tax=Streptomyces anulatus TaxID=1892 RepID=UPI0033DFA465